MVDDAPDSVAGRWRRVNRAVAGACTEAGRDPSAVRILAVTKTVAPERIREAYDAGARLFGENYVQEALAKVDRLPGDARWHLCGHLQRNKAKRAVEIFSAVESLDRPSLAEALENAARARGTRLDALIQVKLGDEETKHGASQEEVLGIARRAGEWPSLRILGLMVIPPYGEDPEASRPYFRELRNLAERVAALSLPGVGMGELSMGMSHDFTVAVEEGATLVRIGTAIFGERG